MITKLTPEQEAQIPVYVQKWVDLASKPIDRSRVKKIVKKVFKEDKIVIIGESLQNTIDLIKVATNGKKLKCNTQLDTQLCSQLRSQLDTQLDIQLDAQLRNQLRSQLDAQLYSQLDTQLYSQLCNQLYAQLDTQLRNQLDSQLDTQLDIQLDAQLRNQLDTQLDIQLDAQLRSQLDAQLYSQLDTQLYSQLCSYVSYFLYDYAGWYDYGKYVGVKFDEDKLQQYFDILLNLPICLFSGNVVFVCEKPQCSWNNGNLHSEHYPAVKWKDNTGIYFLNGIKFPKDLWEKVVSRKMSFKEVMEIEDIDQRTQAMNYCPPNQFLKEKGKLLDKSQRGNELWLVEDVFNIPAYFLKYQDPSTGREYMSGIDPKIGKNKNADECMAWKHHISIEEYQTLKVET